MNANVILPGLRTQYLSLVLGLLLLAPATLLGRNLLDNPGFENGLKGWGGGGGTWTVEATRESVHSGRQAARVSNRTAAEQGLQQLVRTTPEPGKLYQYSAWVKIGTGHMAPVTMTLKKVDDSNGGNPSYYTVARVNAFAQHWTQLQGSFRLQVTGKLRELECSFQGPPAGVDLLVDDAAIEPFQVLPYYWPGFGLLALLGGAFLGTFLTRRYQWSVVPGAAFLALSVALIWSAYTTFYEEMGRRSQPDLSQYFKTLGFETVVNGGAIEIKDRVEVPTLYQGSGVRLYGTCTTNLAIVARLAEIRGRVEGKLYFRGWKLVIMPNAEVVGGIDANCGTVYRLGKVSGPITGRHRLSTQVPGT